MTEGLETKALELEQVWQDSVESIGSHATVDELIVSLGLAAGAAPLGSLAGACYGLALNVCCFVEEVFGRDVDAMVPWLAAQHLLRHVSSSFIDTSESDAQMWEPT